MGVRWIQSAGGPLILLDRKVLGEWGGQGDYQRASEVRDYVGSIPVGTGSGLVLGDEPHDTACRLTPGRLLLVRWDFADSESELWAAVERAREEDYTADDIRFEVQSIEGAALVDSAFEGERGLEEGEVVPLPPGAYRVATAHLQPDEQTSVIVHRLTRES